MIGTVRRLARRVGRRGYALLFFAAVDLIYGASMVWPSPETRTIPLYAYAGRVLPLLVWGAAWIGVGLICLVQSVALRDQVAFSGAVMVKLAWALLALAGWLDGDVPRGYLSATIWAGLAGLVAVIATWPEPLDLLEEPPIGGGP